MAGKTESGFYSGGIVGINITPDTKGFAQRVRVALDAMNMPEVDIAVNTNIDKGRFREQMAELGREHASIPVKLDGDAKSLNALVKKWEHARVNVPVKVDTKFKSKAEYSKLLNERVGGALKDVTRTMDALVDFHPFGDGNETMLEAAKLRKELKGVIDLTDKDPELAVKLGWDETKYKLVNQRLHSLVRDIKEANDKEVRVKFYADNAKSFEDQLTGLRNKYMDLPGSISEAYKSISSRLREVSKQVSDNPDIKYELNLDPDMRKAKSEIEEFQHKHDELKMDIDLQSKTASAHLAYFTRPRTVNIWADFKGSTGGQLIDDMLKGATGLNGVERNFQTLINTFNNLDRTVPRLTAVSAVLTDIGSGAVNVAGTIGGLGSSLVTMASAAQLAPAALAGLGGAFFGVLSAVKTASKQFDVASTKLGGLRTKIGGAFWSEAAKPMREMANNIAPSLIKGLSGIAAEEGHVAVNLMKVVASTDAQKQLPTIFADSASAVSALSPGLDHMVTGFVRMSAAGSKYLPSMTQWLSDMGAKFDSWSEYASNADRLSEAIKKTTEQGGYLVQILGNITGVAGNVFGVFAQGENGLQGMADAAQKIEDVTAGSMFTQTLSAWRDGAQKAQGAIRGSFTDIGASANSLRGVTAQVMADMGSLTGTVMTDVAKLASGIGGGLSNFSSGAVQGVASITDSLAKASPMFSELLTMGGQLSATFGGTFAATLSAASPMIIELAKGTQTIAKAFNALPAPIKGALGLWITFGKAGTSAIGALKQGMLQNITQTLAVKKTMTDLGMSTKEASMGFVSLTKAMLAAKTTATSVATSTSTAAAKLSTVGESATGFKAVATNAESAATSLKGVGTAAETAAQGAAALPARTASGVGAMSKLKSGAGSVIQAFGGLASIGMNLGIGAAMGAASLAMSIYGEETEKSAESQNALNQAIAQTPDYAREAQTSMTTATEEVVKQFDQTFSTWDRISQNLNGMQTDGIDNATDAMQKLGISSEKMAKATTGSIQQYNNAIAKLDKTIDAGTYSNAQTPVPGADKEDDYTRSYSAEASAAKVVKDRLVELRKQYIDSFTDKAALAGKTREYVEQLANEGQNSDSINMTLALQAERTQNLSNAKRKLAEVQDENKKAAISANQAQASYAEQQAGMAEKVKQVQALVGKGQKVWDSQAKSFNFTSEAGRTASDSLAQLASSGNSMIEAMIDSGASLDTVKQKNSQLGKTFIATATQMGVPKQAAKDLAAQYLSTPGKIETLFTAKVEKSKSDMAEYLGSIQQIFPPGERTQEYTTILTGINSGAVDSIDQVSEMAKKLKDENNTVVLDADNKPVIMSVKEAEKYATKAADGTYSMKIQTNGTDTVIKELDTVDALSEAVNGKDVQMLLTATGNAPSSVASLNEMLGAIGLQNKDIEILANAKGSAPAQLKDVKDKLHDLGMSDKQIQWVLDAYDYLTGKADKAKKHVDAVPKEHNSNMTGTGNAQSKADAAKKSVDKVRTTATAHLKADGNAKDEADSVWDSISKWAGKTFSFFTSSRGKDYGANGGGIDEGHNAKGGYISGPGTATSDSIPSWLSNGEFVIKASSVAALEKRYGAGFLNRVNSTGAIPALSKRYSSSARALAKNGYATGGKIRANAFGMTLDTSGFESSLARELRGLRSDLAQSLERRPVNQQFQTVIRPNEDLYVADTILQQTAISAARRVK